LGIYENFCSDKRRQPNTAGQLIHAVFLLLIAIFSLPATAQTNVGDDSTIVYPATYFAQYSPVTALDMINRIPGMNVTDNRSSSAGQVSRGGRGLGSGGNGMQIMINSKRTPGKNNNTQSQLVRINADQVNYIEIIRGTGGDLDVRGSTQIANIVLYEQASNTSLSYEINTDYYADNESQPGGSLSWGGQTGNLNYMISAIAEPGYDHRVAREESILGDLSLNDTIREDRIRDQTTYTLSTNLDYQISSNSSARFNALYTENDDPTTVDRLTTNLRNDASIPFSEREDIPGLQSNWEIGGDYEYSFANGNRFKALFITNENDKANTRERYEVLADGSETKNLFLDSSSTIQERIMRVSYTMDFFTDQDIEFGFERAQTLLDSNLRLAVASDSGIPSPDFGGLVPVAVPNAKTKVEELRYEPFAIHNWRINPRMSLETSLVYEYSEIEQSGDFNNQRDFSFFKPKLDYRFDITPQLQLRLLVEKIVRQISFTDFVASTDAEDNDSDTLAGNTNLRPDFWWNYNLLAEYRLPDDIGVVSANIYKHRHKDFLQRIDVSPSPDVLRSAAGNLGSADMLVFEVKGSVRLKKFNMPNVLVTALANVRDSEVTDPFTGLDRRFNNYHRGQFDIGFRHDLPQWRMNWGVDMRNRIDGNTKFYDIEDVEDSYADPWVTAFVEYIGFGGITFRLDVRNLNDVDRCRDRTRFLGSIRDDILEEIEFNCAGSGRTLSLKVSGNF